ncbi:MAG: sigma-70 family RNA polymerase sigma factor [Candidatus Solibacter sp.]
MNLNVQDSAHTPASLDLEREVASLYEEHAAKLLRYANGLAPTGDLGRDAVQEVFLRYFAERRFGNRMDNPRAWLYRVLHNYLVDLMRSSAMKHEVSSDGTPQVAVGEAGAEAQIEHSQTAQEIASRLTPRELDCLCLRVEGLSYQQIAEMLGVRAGTVSALLPRVYSKLRQGAADGTLVPEGTAQALVLLLRGGQPLAS